jgi:hypothetical protein
LREIKNGSKTHSNRWDIPITQTVGRFEKREWVGDISTFIDWRGKRSDDFDPT